MHLRVDLQRPRPVLLGGAAVLVVLQLGHLLDVLRVESEATFPGVLADPLALVGIGVATAAVVALAAGHRLGPGLAFVAASAVASGFVLQHGIPVEVAGLNNPYFTAADGNRADAIQWATVVAIVAVAVCVAVRAWPEARRSAIGGRVAVR